MILIKPSYVIENLDSSKLNLVEKFGRVCYKSEAKMNDDSLKAFLTNIIKSGHESVIEHFSFSVRFIVDRGVTHELVRHRLAAFSQESTRYCSYNKDKFGNQITYIIPPWLKDVEPGEYPTYASCNLKNKENDSSVWMMSMIFLEERYMDLINNHKWTPQQARAILPNSLKTEIVTTANLREWRHIFKMRTAPDAHPQMREIMIPLLEELKTIIPIVFDQY